MHAQVISHLQTQKPKIAIVSLYDENYKHIGQYSDWNKFSYARKHKYDLYLYHNTLDDTRPTPWSKIIALQNHLQDYEWIMWSDADSLIMNPDIPLENFIDTNYDIIIAQTAADGINTGSFLVKNSAWSYQFLKQVYRQEQFRNNSLWENKAFIYLYEKDTSIRDHVKIVPMRTFNSLSPALEAHFPDVYKQDVYKESDFIIHFAGIPGDQRVALMKEYYYKSVLDELHTQNFPTDSVTRLIGNIDSLEYAFLGWNEYYPVMSRLINNFKLKIGCEVGVAFGMHSEFMLNNTAVEKLYSIDPYQHFNGGYDDPMNLSQETFDMLYYKVKKRLSIFGSRSICLRQKSVDASCFFNSNELDFVFIDANHSYDGVMQDLHAWYDKIRPGGFLVGDDYILLFPGVIRAVNEFFAHKGIKLHQDYEQPRIWWIQKP